MTQVLLKVGKVIIGNGKIVENTSILINGDKIEKIGADIEIRSDCQVHDFSDQVIMPGIIDTHLHVNHDGINADPAALRDLSDEYMAIRGARLVRSLLDYGVTTVGDAGARGKVSFAVKQAIEEGDVIGPRLLACGRMITITGGRDKITRCLEADGVEGVRRVTREELANGADFIKLAATGAISSASTESMSTQFTMEEMQVATEVAHHVGRKTHAHAYGELGIRNTILAGVDVLVHGHPMSGGNIQSMKKMGTQYMPTLVTYYESQKHHDDGDLPEYMVRKEKELFPLIEAGFKDAVAKGVEIVLGSDTGMPYTPFGKSSVQELELFVKMGGMSEMDAIVAGTMNAAKALTIDSYVGTLELGKSVDLIVFAAGFDPLEDISILQQPDKLELVMLKGKIVVGGS